MYVGDLHSRVVLKFLEEKNCETVDVFNFILEVLLSA